MATKQTKRHKDELEKQEGGALPKREVMSVLSTSPGVISIPEDPTIAEPPADQDEVLQPPRHDV